MAGTSGFDVDKVKAKATAFLKGFSPSQLVIIGLLSVVAVVGAVTFLRWVTTPTYGVLLAGLDAQDATAVIAQLEEHGTPYQLAAGGSTIMVPTAVMDEERLAVAAEGLPAGKTDSGWAAFDEQGLTSSSFQQQVAYQRAMEATLSSSVGEIEGVRSAEVHLALPEKKLFTEDRQPARASVLVTTDGSLGDEAIEAMTHLVASSVPDLSASDVSVTDSSGRLLTTDGTGAGNDRAAKARTELETTLEGRATTMFDQLLGPGRAVVRVNAEIDTANRTVDSETFDDSKKSVLSSSTTEETYTTPGGTTEQDTVGLTDDPATPVDESAQGYSKTSSAVQNGVSRTVEREVVGPGGVKRLTVAVAVDRNARNAPGAAELQAMVANAVGLDPARGDTISVTTPSFLQPEEEPAAEETAGSRSQLTALVPQVLGGVLLLLVSLGLLRTVRRGVSTELSAAEVTAALGATGGRTAVAAGAPAALPAGAVPAPRREDDDLLARLDDPDEVAGMLRGWLASTGGDR